MEDDKPLESDASDQVQENIEDLFEDEAGKTDDVAATESDVSKLSLEEINNISGRKFESKEDFFKHYENLKNFVGKKQEPKKEATDTSLKEELAQLKKELAKKDFVVSMPTAKEALPALEAFAERKGISLDEAWNHEEFKPIATALSAKGNEGTEIISKQRINPVNSQRISDLSKAAQAGNDQAAQELVKEVLGESLGLR